MTDQVRIYSGDTVKVVSLDKNKGLSLGEGPSNQVQFPPNSCPDSSGRFYFQRGGWNVVCTGEVYCSGKPASSGRVVSGEMFVLNRRSHLAVQFIQRQDTAPVTVSLEGLEELLIGRSASCALQLSHNKVSGGHAKLYLDGTGWRICDINSTNGTFVNGKRVQDQLLRDGDVIFFCP